MKKILIILLFVLVSNLFALNPTSRWRNITLEEIAEIIKEDQELLDNFLRICAKDKYIKKEMDGQYIDFDDMIGVDYFKEEYLDNIELKIRRGKITRDVRLKIENKDEYLFAMNSPGRIYFISKPEHMLLHEEKEKKLPWYTTYDEYRTILDPDFMFHSSFFHRQPVECAGCLYFKNEKLIKINDESGHYQPKLRHVLQVVHSLIKKGLVFKDLIVEAWEIPHKFSIKHNMLHIDNKYRISIDIIKNRAMAVIA